MQKSAGLHVIMDAYVHDSSVFTRETLTNLFTRLISALEMKALDEIMIYEVPVNPEVLARVKLTGNFEDEGGTSVVQVISTSHLALHAWPLQNYFSFDAFSCKDFDADLTLSILRSVLGIKSENTLIVSRCRPSEEGIETRVEKYDCSTTR